MNLNRIQSTVKKTKITSVVGSVVGANQNLSQVLSVSNDGGGLQIKNIGDPTNNQDAVTLAYFNAHQGGAVTSVFGRTGAVSAQAGDYSSFYLPLSGATGISTDFILGVGIGHSINLIGGNSAGNVTIKGGVGGGTAELIDENNTAGFNATSDEAFMFNSTMSLDMASGMVFTDANSKGIQYAATGYVTQTHSLVDKEYSDTHFKGFIYTNSPSTGNAAIFNGTNWTFQSPWSLLSGGTLTGANTITGTTSNTLKFSFASLGITQTDGAGIWLQNPAEATSGNQQISPSITWEGQGYATTPAAPQTVKFISDVLPVQGTNASATWRLRYSLNGSAYGDAMTLASSPVNSNMVMVLGNNGGAGIINTSTNGDLKFYTGSNLRINILGSGTNAGSVNIGNSTSALGWLYVLQPAATSGWIPALRSDSGAHTGMTASTEFISRDFQGSTQQWTTGSLTTQRWNYFRGYTAAFVGASTLTDAYTIYADAPTAGTNATITNSWAAGFNGSVKIVGATGLGYMISNSGALQGIRLSSTAKTIDIGSFSGGGNQGNINFVDNNGGVTYARFSPSTAVTTFSFGTSTANAFSYWAPTAQSSAWIPALRIDPAAHTALTAATEFISNDFRGATQTWIDGTTTTQRFNYFRGYTVNKTTTSATFTDIYNVYIDTNTAGPGVTFSNNWALGIAGNVKMTGSRILLTGLPTSASGLPTGALWNNSGIINIAP